MKKRSFPETAFFVAGKGSRPMFGDPVQRYPEASAAFYRLLKLMAPVLATEDYSWKAERRIEHLIPDLHQFYPRGHGASVHDLSATKREAFNELWNTVQRAIELSHAAGVDRGRDLLSGLASGALTVKQFNDATINKSEE
jgi:hypothetical protein